MKKFISAIAIFISTIQVGLAQDDEYIKILMEVYSHEPEEEVYAEDAPEWFSSHSSLTEGVGVLIIKNGNVEIKCTGTLIGDKYIITSARCVNSGYSSFGEGSYAEEISFIPGLLTRPAGSNDRYFISKFWISKHFAEENSKSRFAHGVAVLEVKLHYQKLPGTEYGQKEIGYHPFQKSSTHEGRLVAYPISRLFGYTYLNIGRKNKFWGHEESLLPKYPLFKYKETSEKLYQPDFKIMKSVSGGPIVGTDGKIYGIFTNFSSESVPYLISRITEETSFNINEIISGRPENAVDFTSKEIPGSAYFSINLYNKCDEPITVYALYKAGYNGEFISEGFSLEPDRFISGAFRTKNRHLGFYAENDEKDLLWTGNDYEWEVSKGRTLPFYSRTLPDSWTDQTYTWSCE